MADELFEGDILTLTDEEGNENQFEVIGTHELNGITYMALVPYDEKGDDREEAEYVILKMEIDENGEEVLVTIDDNDEFDRIADIFDEKLFEEIDYDDEDESDEDFDEDEE